ncbi:uncharacterized protein LOC131841007 [Achroia grisella]|uniref:uncharacterized protein LOC131841007 n=1 Tax=Achroia grisella TaxID=688607 RepID=UPI0027D1F337|nr:uncharacterized protein LOC131841007 [Achroia grisella]
MSRIGLESSRTLDLVSAMTTNTENQNQTLHEGNKEMPNGARTRRDGEGFRIEVDLRLVFGDARARVLAWVRPRRRARALLRRLRRLRLPGPVALLVAGRLLPLDEPLALLAPGDTVQGSIPRGVSLFVFLSMIVCIDLGVFYVQYVCIYEKKSNRFRVVPLSKELPIDYEYEEESDFDDTEYTSSCVTSENKRKRHCYDSKGSTYPPDTDIRNDKQYSDNVYNEKYLSKKKCIRNGNKHENFSNLIYNEFINNVCNSSNKRKRHPNEGIHRESAATRTRGQQHNNDDRRNSTTSEKANHRRFDDHASEDTDRTEGNESSELNDNVINNKETDKLFIEEPTHDGRGGAVPSYASAATLAEVKRRALQLLERYEDGRPPGRDHGRRPGQRSEDERPVQRSEDERPVQRSADERPVQRSEDERPVQRSEDERPVQRSEDERPVQRSEDERPVQRAGEERSEGGRPRTRRRRVRRRRQQPVPGDVAPGTPPPGDSADGAGDAAPGDSADGAGDAAPGDSADGAGDAAPAPVIRNASQHTRPPRVVRSLSPTSPYDPKDIYTIIFNNSNNN